MTESSPKRTVLCQDALPWLRAQMSLNGAAVITSLPHLRKYACRLPRGETGL